MSYICPTAAKNKIITGDGGHPKVPRTEAALPPWRATDTCCKMKAPDCASLVTALPRLPMSAKKSRTYIYSKMVAPWGLLTLLNYYSLCPHLWSHSIE